MPFKHIVDNRLKIVVLKSVGDITVTDVISEIKQAISTKRGAGFKRRLIDMTEREITFELTEVQKILGAMKNQAKVLQTRKIALLFKSMPSNFDLTDIESLLSSETLDIGIFIDKKNAVEFLNSKT